MISDLCYQAIPHNCSLIDEARLRPVFGEFLEMYGFREVSFEDLKFRIGDEDFAYYSLETKDIRRQFPGIERRRLELGRNWDVLLYLLSEARRKLRPGQENHWAYRAIHGGDILGISICSTQGMPIRFLPPYSVRKIADEIGKVSFEALEAKIDIGKMRDADVVGIEKSSTETILEGAKEDLSRLRDFYSSAAAFSEGVVTISV